MIWMMNKIKFFAAWFTLIFLLLWIADVNGHETKKEKVQDQVVSRATEDNHDKILLLRTELELLRTELDATRTKQKLLGQSYTEFTENSEIQQEQEHRDIIKIIPKPIPEVTIVDLPPQKPEVELAFIFNKYWAVNKSNFSVQCTFFANAKQDLDHDFILNAKQTLGYKITLNKKPDLECRQYEF